MSKHVLSALLSFGLAGAFWAGWSACQAPDLSPAPASLPAEVPAADRGPSVGDLCDAGGSWKRRVYVNVTYESADPGWAMAVAQRELQHREGETTYAAAGDRRTSSSLSGWLPAGTDLSWLSEIDVGRVVNISNSDSPIQPELDQACERLAAVERGEGIVLDALKGGADREAAGVTLELQRQEITNLRARIRSLRQEADRAQVNLYFNPPPG